MPPVLYLKRAARVGKIDGDRHLRPVPLEPRMASMVGDFGQSQKWPKCNARIAALLVVLPKVKLSRLALNPGTPQNARLPASIKIRRILDATVLLPEYAVQFSPEFTTSALRHADGNTCQKLEGGRDDPTRFVFNRRWTKLKLLNITVCKYD